jgi:uncharacterized membrane protein YecN with MAPEG domain
MQLVPPLISIFSAGILIIMQMALMLSVVLVRRRARQSLGDGGDHALQQAIRRHGNFAENAAIFVVGAALLELVGGNRTGISILCAIFILGRISHAIGLSMKKTANLPRTMGVVLTAIAGFTLGVRLLGLAVSGWQV